MSIFENKYLIENLSNLASAFVLAATVSFLVTPLVARLAKKVGAIDKPASQRRKGDATAVRRIHLIPTPKLGGLAMVVAIVIGLIVTNSFGFIPRGIVFGAIIVIILGILDDIFELDGKVQLALQFFAAAIVVLTGTSITGIHFLGNQINFNAFSALVEVLGFTYNFIFPADLITILWIVGLINVINWVGGVDALNGSVSSIAAFTMLLFAITSGNIPLAIILAIHLGSIQGVLPYNYNPAKIYYGSVGDYLNGYLLAVFAILGSTRWTATLILLGMPIIDGLLVFMIRFREHPELLKQPWKVLNISDNNHLHHRLLAAGYSKKTVNLIETAIMSVLCAIAIVMSDIRQDVMAFIVSITILFVIFAVIFFLKKRNEKQESFVRVITQPDEEEPQKETVITVIDDPEDEEKKFVY